MQHVLADTRLLRLSDYRCDGRDSQGEEHNASDSIAWVRRGVFERHTGRRRTVANANHVLFFNRGAAYRVVHPVRCRDACTVLVLQRELLESLRRDLGLADGAFSFPEAPCPAALQWQHGRLLARAGVARDPLEIEELAIAAAAAALRAGQAAAGGRIRAPRPATQAAHRRLADDVRLLLGASPEAPWTLHDIARRVASSPYHLCRVFRAQQGESIHAYRTRLRLGLALPRLCEPAGGSGLTRLALELGFADHAHFSNAFRRGYGCTPREAREQLRSPAAGRAAAPPSGN